MIFLCILSPFKSNSNTTICTFKPLMLFPPVHFGLELTSFFCNKLPVKVMRTKSTLPEVKMYKLQSL